MVSFDQMLGGCRMRWYRITDIVDMAVSCEVFVYDRIITRYFFSVGK